MHELALCASVADIVRRHAAGRRVDAARIRVGQLRQVVPTTLEYCWGLVVESTDLDGCILEIEHVPARLRCVKCGQQEMGPELCFDCPSCGRPADAVVAGEEFLVASIDVAAPVGGEVASGGAP